MCGVSPSDELLAPHQPLIIVTGASSGIGAAVAHRLARRREFRLLLTGRNVGRLEEVAASCRQSECEVTIVPADLADRKELSRFVDACRTRRPVGGLVNCAGVGRFASVENVLGPAWDEVLSVNLTATFLLCRDVGTMLAEETRAGSIINISSDADSTAFPGAAAYCASKAGVLALSRVLQLELHHRGVRVSVISPGRVDTHFNNKRPGMRPGALLADQVAEVVEFVLYCSPNIEIRELRIDSMSRDTSARDNG